MRIKYADIQTVKSVAKVFKRWFGGSHIQSLDKISIISGYRNYEEIQKLGLCQQHQETKDLLWADENVRAVQSKLGDMDFYKLQNFLMKYMSFPSSHIHENAKFFNQFRAFRSGIVFVTGHTWLDRNTKLLECLMKVQEIMKVVGNPAQLCIKKDDTSVSLMNGETSSPCLLFKDTKGPSIYFPSKADCQDIYEYIDLSYKKSELRFPGDILTVCCQGENIIDVQRSGYNLVSQNKIEATIAALSKETLWSGRSIGLFPLLCDFMKPYLARKGERATINLMLEFMVSASSEETLQYILNKWGINKYNFIKALFIDMSVFIKEDDLRQFEYNFSYAKHGLLDLLNAGYKGDEIIL